jgi:hypothetical protein
MNFKVILKGLVVAALMLIASVGYSQNYLPADQALEVLNLEIQRVKDLPNNSQLNGTVVAPQASIKKAMKIAILGKMIESVSQFKAVAPAFSDFDTMLSTQPTERRALVQPYLNELKNLLS